MKTNLRGKGASARLHGVKKLPSNSLPRNLVIKVHQKDWMPGFAAFLNNGSVKKGTAHISLNLGEFMAAIHVGDIDKQELPYFIAETLMHEIIHALEAWAGVEFSHRRINALLKKYKEAARR